MNISGSQPPINAWFGNASPGLFGPSRFQSPVPSQPVSSQPVQTNIEAGSGISELKNIMLDVQNSVRSMESRFTQLDKSMQEIRATNEKLVESNDRINENVKTLNDRVELLESKLKDSEEKRERLEAQSRRENLRFYGMSEDRDESWEGTENKIRDYISKDLEMDQSTISIERAHRIQSSEKPRPVIVKFSFYKDKERILKSYRQKRRASNEREKERGANRESSHEASNVEHENEETGFRKDITICEDFPSRVMKARNDLRKFLRDALANGSKAFLRYDKLVIEGDVYEYDAATEDIILIDK
ncbi:MAG: hypothetical protein AB2693_15715 [Candidatus Thiodiazotropha sp.]